METDAQTLLCPAPSESTPALPKVLNMSVLKWTQVRQRQGVRPIVPVVPSRAHEASVFQAAGLTVKSYGG